MRSEKGSITFFVLVAMVFFIAIALTAYMSAMSKLQAQNDEIEQITANYEQGISDEALAELYKNLTGNYEVYSTGEVYATLEEAIANAGETDTIIVLKDVEDSSEAVISKNITLDSNNKTLTKTTASITVNEGKTFEITGEGIITTSDLTSLLEISGDLIKTGSGTIYGGTDVINLSENGNVTIESGIVSGETHGILMDSNNTGTVTIEGGEITGVTSNTIGNRGSGTIIVNDGKLIRESGGNYVLASTGDGTIEINGGEIAGGSESGGISIYKGTNVTITGGTITGGNSISSAGITCQSTHTGTVIIEDGEIIWTSSKSGNAIYNEGNGTVIINGGKITNAGEGSHAVLTATSGGKVEVNGGELTSTDNQDAVISIWEEADVTITGGILKGATGLYYQPTHTGTAIIKAGYLEGTGRRCM